MPVKRCGSWSCEQYEEEHCKPVIGKLYIAFCAKYCGRCNKKGKDTMSPRRHRVERIGRRLKDILDMLQGEMWM